MRSSVIIVLLALVVACMGQTIFDVVGSNANLTSLSGQLSNAPGLGAILSNTATNKTLVAPNNSGLSQLSTLNNTGIYPDINTTLYYHVGEFTLPASLPLDSNYSSLVAGKVLRFNNYSASTLGLNNITTVNGQPYTQQLVASNGEIKVIGSVLYPPLGNALTALARLPEFSLINTLIIDRASNSTKAALNSNEVTVFLPNNTAVTAFNDSLISTGTNLNSLSDTQINNLLANHVLSVRAAIFSRALPASLTGVATLLPGSTLNITVSGSTVTVTAAAGSGAVVNPDLVIDGGVAHGISGVLVPNGIFPAPSTTGTGTTGTTSSTTGSSTSSSATAIFSIFVLVVALFAAIF